MIPWVRRGEIDLVGVRLGGPGGGAWVVLCGACLVYRVQLTS